nr:MAG TPA: hypothetical protein [Caudoviricetes sp.]
MQSKSHTFALDTFLEYYKLDCKVKMEKIGKIF